jgi:hypothetical protein
MPMMSLVEPAVIRRHLAMRAEGRRFATLSQVLGAVAQSGSAPRSHRGGQGFKSPQLHREIAGRVACSISWLLGWEPLWEPGRKLPVWLGLRAVATAKTESTSITGATAGDSALHKTCSGRWRGGVSLGFDADGKRVRRKVSGRTKAEVKDKLKALHSELDAGVRSAAGYTVEKAVADWLDEGLPGRTVKTVETNRDSLRPLLAVIGAIPVKDLTVQDVRTALKRMAGTHATRTLQKAHNCLTRALRHAEGQDLVRRNVSALVDTPRGLEGRRSQSLALAEASALLEAAESSRLHAFIVLCLLTGVRSEEARALTWEHPAMVRGYSCGWLRPRPPIPARTVTSGEPARRVAYGPATTSWCRDPDLIARVTPLVYGTGSRHRPVRQTLPISARASCAQLREDMDLAGRPAIFTEGSAPWYGLAVTAISPLGLGALVWARGDCHKPISLWCLSDAVSA